MCVVAALGGGPTHRGARPFADVCIDDPAVELHHGMLDVGAGGEVGFTQLTGRVPITVAVCRVRGRILFAPMK